MVVFPNAKINLGLNILRKRADGYHDIESVFLPVDICDVLEFVESDSETTFQSTGIDIPGNPMENLCVKAWRIMHKNHNIPPVNIHLHKVIPIGAGLGGGSADGAFMVTALNQHFELNLNNTVLKEYAAMLGSDCPFFIDNKPCYVTGTGNLLEPIGLKLETIQILLVYPNLHIGTAEAYAGIVPCETTISLTEIVKLPIGEWQHKLKNDFEQSLFPSYQQLEDIKQTLIDKGAVYASLTGSGSVVYGFFNQKDLPAIKSFEKYQVYSVRLISG